jgi:hypothetical protein
MNTQTETYDPSTIEIGGTVVESTKVTILSGQTLAAGSVLGRVTASGKYVLSLAAAEDGSEVIQPVVAMHAVDASAGDVVADVWIAGKFDASKLVIGAGHAIADVRLAFLGTPMFAPSAASV